MIDINALRNQTENSISISTLEEELDKAITEQANKGYYDVEFNLEHNYPEKLLEMVIEKYSKAGYDIYYDDSWGTDYLFISWL